MIFLLFILPFIVKGDVLPDEKLSNTLLELKDLFFHSSFDSSFGDNTSLKNLHNFDIRFQEALENLEMIQPKRTIPPPSVKAPNLPSNITAALSARRTQISNWTLTVDGAAAQDGCRTTRPSCDCTFWNGLLTSSGSEELMAVGSTTLSRSQSADGRLWRTPWGVNNASNPDTFSRDQGLGTLNGLVQWSNATFYSMWLNYIEKTGSMCPGEYDCLLIVPFWCTFQHVANYHNWTAPSPHLMFPQLGADICQYDSEFVYLATIVNSAGFPVHLASLDVFIRQRMNIWDSTLQAAADHIHAREPANPFYHYLSKGANVDVAGAALLQSSTPYPHKRSQWSFQRTDSEQAWLESMGWEFRFLIDLLIGSPTTQLETCNHQTGSIHSDKGVTD